MDKIVLEALNQATTRRCDKTWMHRLTAAYWGSCFIATKVIERIIPQSKVLPSRVLNFGCGLNFLPSAVNSDLWAPHRYLKSRKKPDLYWTGVVPLDGCSGYFDVIICEHVIEHLLPDSALQLFNTLFASLSKDGVLLLSYPDIKKVLSGTSCQGYEYSIVAANSLIYRHGHSFMYDTELASALLTKAQFTDITHSNCLPEKYSTYLVSSREPESVYLVARK